MNFRCMVIEDHHQVNELNQFQAKLAGFEVDFAFNAENFLNENDFDFHCYIVDWNLPGMSGIELIPFIRKASPMSHIIMVTSLQSQEDIQAGYDAGVDDYIWKPHDYNQLRYKLSNTYKRLERIFERDINSGVKLIQEAHLLVIEGQKVVLSQAEFKIASVLYANIGQSVSREELQNSLQTDSQGRMIDVHLHSIRKKTQEMKLNIKSQRGMGYIWTN